MKNNLYCQTYFSILIFPLLHSFFTIMVIFWIFKVLILSRVPFFVIVLVAGLLGYMMLSVVKTWDIAIQTIKLEKKIRKEIKKIQNQVENDFLDCKRKRIAYMTEFMKSYKEKNNE